jgi:hypothetical protein
MRVGRGKFRQKEKKDEKGKQRKGLKCTNKG